MKQLRGGASTSSFSLFLPRTNLSLLTSSAAANTIRGLPSVALSIVTGRPPRKGAAEFAVVNCVEEKFVVLPRLPGVLSLTDAYFLCSSPFGTEGRRGQTRVCERAVFAETES